MNSDELLKKIDDMLVYGPVMDIHHYEQARNTYELIANNAEVLNKAGYGGFFGHIQNTLLTDMILRVCRMFESFRNHEMRTFPCVLEIMKNNADVLPIYQPEVEDPIYFERLKKARRAAKGPKGGGLIAVSMPPRPERVANADKTLLLVEDIESTMPKGGKKPKSELSQYYVKLKTQRNKEVAHNELIESSKIDRPTFEMLEELTCWAKMAIGKIRKSVLPEIPTFLADGAYIQSRDAWHSYEGLRAMLRDLGADFHEEDSPSYIKLARDKMEQ